MSKIEYTSTGIKSVFDTDSPLVGKVQSSTSTPSSGYSTMYPKSDGWYTKDSAGTESKLNTGSVTVTDPVYALYNVSNSAYGTGIINFNNKIKDSHDAVTTGSGWKFTVPTGMGGVYNISVMAPGSGGSNSWTGAADLTIIKNGSDYHTVDCRHFSGNTGYMGQVLTGSKDIYLNAGDYIQASLSGTFGGSGAALNNSFITIHKVDAIKGDTGAQGPKGDTGAAGGSQLSLPLGDTAVAGDLMTFVNNGGYKAYKLNRGDALLKTKILQAGYTSVSDSCYDPVNKKHFIAYKDDTSTYLYMVMATTDSSGNITYGSIVTTTIAVASYISVAYDTNTGKVLVSYTISSDTTGRSLVATVSGDSITYGTPVTFNAQGTTYVDSYYDASVQKVVVLFTDSGGSSYLSAIVGTISGTAVSFGSKVALNAFSTSYISSCYSSYYSKAVICYNASGLKAGTITVTGNVPAFGGAYDVDTTTCNSTSCCYDIAADRFIFAYYDTSDGTAKVNAASLSGNVLTIGTIPCGIANSNTTYIMGLIYDSANQNSVLYFSGIHALSLYRNHIAVIKTNLVNAYVQTKYFANYSTTTFNISHHSFSLDTDNGIFLAFGSWANGTSKPEGQTYKASFLSNMGYITTNSEQTFTNGVVNHVYSVYDTKNKKHVCVYADSSTGYVYCKLGAITNGTTLTWGSAQLVLGSAVTIYAAHFDSYTGRIVIIYNGGAGNYLLPFSISGESIYTYAGVAMTNAVGKTCIDSYNGVLLVASVNASNYLIVHRVRFNGDTYVRETTFTDTAVWYPMDIKYTSPSTAAILGYSATPNVEIKTLTGTSNSVLIATTTIIEASYGGFIGYLAKTEKEMFASAGVAANKLYVTSNHYSSGHFVYGYRDLTDLSEVSTSPMILVTNTKNNTVCIIKGLFYHLTAKISDTKIITTGEYRFSTSLPASGLQHPYKTMGAVYDEDEDKIVVVFRDNTSTNLKSCVLQPYPSERDFDGILATSGSSGDTRAVDLPGKVSSTQTGLTAGKRYYIQPDCTIGTRISSTPLGLSTSTTDILI